MSIAHAGLEGAYSAPYVSRGFRRKVVAISGGRDRDRHADRGHHVGRDHGSRGRDRDPSGDRVGSGPDPLPNILRKIVRRHGVVRPNELPRKADESNSLHAIYNVFRPDTNNPVPTRIRILALRERPSLAVAVALR